MVLPEMFACLGSVEAMVASAETVPGPTSDALCQLARGLQITLVAGSYAERSPQPGKVFNTSLLIGPFSRARCASILRSISARVAKRSNPPCASWRA